MGECSLGFSGKTTSEDGFSSRLSFAPPERDVKADEMAERSG